MDWTAPSSFAGYFWLIFLLYSLVSAARVKATKESERWNKRLLCFFRVSVAFLLLFDPQLRLGW